VHSETTHYLRLAKHAATLTRLKLRISELERESRAHGRGHHLRAALTAYDQALLLAGSEIGVSDLPDHPLSAASRLGLEAELILAGLRW
jgi:hypothetical protein